MAVLPIRVVGWFWWWRLRGQLEETLAEGGHGAEEEHNPLVPAEIDVSYGRSLQPWRFKPRLPSTT